MYARTESPRSTRSALDAFATWTNYLLIGSVAALGWVAENGDHVREPWRTLTIWCLVASIVTGMLTLGLIPLLGQQLDDTDTSIYERPITFHVIRPWGVYLTNVCRPQHLSFMAGMVFYAIGSATPHHLTAVLVPLVVFAVVVVVAAASTPRSGWSRRSRTPR